MEKILSLNLKKSNMDVMEFKIGEGKLADAFDTYTDICEEYIKLNPGFVYEIEMDEDSNSIRIELKRDDTSKSR